MNQSNEINELATALSKAQGEMQTAIKDKLNPFFKSMYADLGSVWDVARPVLSKNGLAVVQTTEMNGNEIIMVTTLIHSSGQWMKSFLPLILSKRDSQGIGAAITYLRRYSLSAIVGVVCDDDDDGETACGRGKANNDKKPQKSINTTQTIKPVVVLENRDELLMQLSDIMIGCGQEYEDKVLKHFAITSIDFIPDDQLNKVIKSALAFRELKRKQEESEG